MEIDETLKIIYKYIILQILHKKDCSSNKITAVSQICKLLSDLAYV